MVGRKTTSLAGWLFIFCVLAVVPAAPQEPLSVRLESDLVTVDVTVMDREGNYVTGLGKDDFTIFHDDVPSPISFFEAEKQASLTRPLAVVFALDVSGSLGAQVAEQQQAARRFVSLVQKPSMFAVIGFNDRVRVYQKFTSDPDKVIRAFGRATDIGGRTRLYDAIDQAITMLVKEAPAKHNDRRLRRVVVVITDGIDYTSVIGHKELIRRANDAGVTVYSITLPSYIMSVRGRERVPTLLDAAGIVKQTGGMDFSAEERNFTRVFRSIAEEIRASYMLAYYPPRHSRRDGQTHRIKVEARRPDVVVRQSRYEYTAKKR